MMETSLEQEGHHHRRAKWCGEDDLCRSFLPAEAQCPRFINADLIAAGLAPFAPETAAVKAGRLMLREMAECARRGESFAVETTLSGLVYLRHVPNGGGRATT
jgi:predicted ABC-type ATPase